MNLYLLSLLVVEFTQGMDSCYQYHHDTWTMSMRHIFYFYLPLFPFLHPRLYPYKIHFISFLVLSPLKLRLYQVEFHPDPQKWSHFMSSESLTPWHWVLEIVLGIHWCTPCLDRYDCVYPGWLIWWGTFYFSTLS